MDKGFPANFAAALSRLISPGVLELFRQRWNVKGYWKTPRISIEMAEKVDLNRMKSEKNIDIQMGCHTF